MRRTFFRELTELMPLHPNLYVLTGDLGYKGFDDIRMNYEGERFFNVGAAEQSLADIAVGLAYSGKLPIIYSITPFLIYRPFETLRTYINKEQLAIIMVGSGRDGDYAHDGFSHDATDVRPIMDQFQNITSYYPMDNGEIRGLLESVITNPHPSFISLKR